MAAYLASKPTVQFLIEKLKMNQTETGFLGRNCFMTAAYGGKIETLIYLNSNFPELKSKRDDQQSNALTLACTRAGKETIQFLIEEVGMSVTKTGYNGQNCSTIV